MAVVEKGSFVRAAESLELSPAAVTEHVQVLERRLNSKLLHRTTRRLSLTEEGAAYFEQCRRILAQMEEADAMLASQRESPKGTLRVMMPALLGTLIVIPRIAEFLDRYPDLRVDVTLSPQAPDFVAQNLDVCLQLTTQPDPPVVFRPFGLCAVRTVATPEYLARHGTPGTPEDLAHHHLIGVRAAPGILLSAMRFQKDGRMFAYDAKCRFIADAGDAQRVAGLAHAGIFQGYHYTVADLIASGELGPSSRNSTGAGRLWARPRCPTVSCRRRCRSSSTSRAPCSPARSRPAAKTGTIADARGRAADPMPPPCEVVRRATRRYLRTGSVEAGPSPTMCSITGSPLVIAKCGMPLGSMIRLPGPSAFSLPASNVSPCA